MNLEVLLNNYRNDPRIKQIAESILLPGASKIHLKGLAGSLSQFILSAIFTLEDKGDQNHLVIMQDAEEAAYFHNTLENLTDALQLFYFPSSFKNRKNYNLLNTSHVMLRTEALAKLSTPGRRRILVTYPEAIFEKVALSKAVSDNMINIKQSDELNTDTLFEKLVSFGFVKSDFVYEPGQFALRGGIVDIYSYGNEKPYRIELFGKEVDSIRIFDPESQLSERKLLQVSIIPNVETTFDEKEKISLFEFMPTNTTVWLRDWEFIRERIAQQEDDLLLFLEHGPGSDDVFQHDEDERTDTKKSTADEFINAGELEQNLQSRTVIETGSKASFSGTTISFNSAPQPAFNRQFCLLYTSPSPRD